MSVTNAQEVKDVLEVHRALPIPAPEGSPVAARGTRYGGTLVENVIPTKHNLAEEGSYFVATNPTPGAAVTYALQTAFSDTAALFVVKNNSSVTDPKAKRVNLDYLRLILTAAPTATVSMHFAIKLDNISRIPTAGFSLLTYVNPNMDDSTGSVAQLWAPNAAALTVPASSGSARLVSRCSLQTSLGIVGDEYTVQFGGIDHHGAHAGLTAARAVAPAKMTVNTVPIAIGPQQFAIVYMWWLTAATAAPQFEFELAQWER